MAAKTCPGGNDAMIPAHSKKAMRVILACIAFLYVPTAP